MSALRPLWEFLCRQGRATIFQDFRWNMLVLRLFAAREEPCVVCAETSYGLAIVPAVVRHGDDSLRLLGEELFDYRCFLYEGDDGVLLHALSELSTLKRPLKVTALREQDRKSTLDGFALLPFSAAPQVRLAETSPEEFAARHGRLGRNFRRLEREGFVLKSYFGDNPRLVRSIYERKAGQDASSLFHDPLRIEFLVQAAQIEPQAFEIFTLERGSCMAAALVTLRDGAVRRFYTGWFAPEFEERSPAMTLIYEATRRSLTSGLACDYMTGEQSYKMRLATSSVPLYSLQVSLQYLPTLGRLGSRLHEDW